MTLTTKALLKVLYSSIRSSVSKIFKYSKFVLSIITNYYKFVLKYCFRFEIFSLWLFLETTWGYTFYTYTVFFVIGAKPLVMELSFLWQVVWLVCVFLIGDVIRCALQFWLILANKSSKEWLYDLVGYGYVVNCIGNPGGYKILFRSIKPLVMVATADAILQVAQTEINHHAAQRYRKDCHKSNLPVDPKHLTDLHTPRGGLAGLATTMMDAFRSG